MPKSLPDLLIGEGRLLLLSAPSPRSPAFEEQMDVLDEVDEERAAKNVRLAVMLEEGTSRLEDQTLSEDDRTAIQEHFELKSRFEILLIDREGRILRRDDAPLKPNAIFSSFEAASA
jgi:hypothetical protein